jgi:glutaredoxin
MNKKLSSLNKIIILISVAIFAWLAIDLFVLDGRQLSQPKNDDAGQETNEVLAENGEPVDSDIFYWGDGCPHCQDVKDWMAENNFEEKVKIVSKEVYNNQANSEELTARAESCGLDTQRIGVPFLYTTDGNCLIGTPNIIEYFSAKIAE